MASWTGRALLYAGRPDPSWPVAPEIAAALVAEAARLEPAPDAPRPPSRLGYRGALLTGPDGSTWLGLDGFVHQPGPAGRLARRDPARRFETALLRTAPPGLLPPELVAP